MKTSCMKNVLKKLAFPLVACGFLWTGASAWAQLGDIVSIFSDQPNFTYSASGDQVEIKIKLDGGILKNGIFSKRAVTGTTPSEYFPPELRLVVNGKAAWAPLSRLNAYQVAAGNPHYRTEAVFTYTIKPGDMATPLRIFGSAGSSGSGAAFQFYMNNWEIYNTVTTSNAVWRLNMANTGLEPGVTDYYDVDFSGANVKLRTLEFDEVRSPITVAATESTSWRVSSVNPVAPSNVVDCVVWTPSNVVQIGTVAGQSALPVNIPGGATYVDFPVKGLVEGETEIYLQRAQDYANNATVGVTNYIKRKITVTTAPAPTVSIRMTSSGTDSATLSESAAANTGALIVDISQAFSNDVYVSLSTLPSGQSNLTFAAALPVVTIPAGSTSSSEVRFSVPDGTVLSESAGIEIVPSVTNTAAQSFYSRMKSGYVYVANVTPEIVSPQTNETFTVSQNTAYPFTWSVRDVNADKLSGMTVTWKFGTDPATNVTGATGTILHTFPITPAAKVYKVEITATDKDGDQSETTAIYVTATPPTPSPSVRVIPSASYFETTTNNTGSLMVVLSEAYSENVYVKLSTDPAVQNNLILSTTNAIRILKGELTNAIPVTFSVPDGTVLSEQYGIEIVPTVTNASAAAYYTDLVSALVTVKNNRPVVGSPVAGSSVGPIPATVPYTFNYTVKDVTADLSTMIVNWRFTEGGPIYTVTGAVGSVAYTYMSQGTNTVWMQAVDKDGGVSDEVQFTVYVGQAPGVEIITPAGELSETANAGIPDQIYVRLTTPYTYATTVTLNVTPANSTGNGTLTLSAYTVVIPAGQIEAKINISNVKDGTDISRNTGFMITPVVGAQNNADAFFSNNMPGYVYIRNEKPEINTPEDTDTTAETVVYTVAQGTAWTYYWDITDVALDSTSTVGTGMKVTWYFGDGEVSPALWGRSGSVSHTYTAIGDLIVRMVAEDKDGGRDQASFKIRVAPAKAVNVTPVGPVRAGAYAGAQGLGNGIIRSYDAVNRAIEQNVFFFKYNPSVTSADLVAEPYKTSKNVAGDIVPYTLTNYITRVSGIPNVSAFGTPNGSVEFDSFFYVWVGADQGLPAEAVVPLASPVTSVTLPASTTDAATTGSSSSSVEIRLVQAVFSREYRATDNIGDINNDGIPDPLAILYGFPTLLGTDLTSAKDYNADLDYLPGAASDGGGLIGGNLTTWAAVGRPFTAFLEIRGYHEGLNNKDYGSDDDFGPGEEEVTAYDMSPERPTDPTKLDTDGDGFPDGWEYYFWYNAVVNHLTGRRYNPNDIASGQLLDWPEIYAKFDPITPATDAFDTRDLDNDGITDYEELVSGTNPINWDSDNDGMCDGWEILRGLNPTEPRDATDAGMNNLDGDYMAYGTVQGDYVPVVLDGATNYYLRVSTVNDPLPAYYTWFNYGASNAPIALGRPVDLPVGAAVDEEGVTSLDVLVLHFQAYQVLGFDPRTAWTRSVNPAQFPNRFMSYLAGNAPNTKAFTTLDEYLLMKIMSENRVNGAGATIGAGNAENKTREWSAFSTNPLTPDSDANATKDDGMPDGWELYVACAPGSRVFAISPWNPDDGRDNNDENINPVLNNRREFAGTDSCAAYTNAALYASGPGRVTIVRPGTDTAWLNKFWPTDPWNADTDGDALEDGVESATQVPVAFLMDGSWWTVGDTTLQYGLGVDNGKGCIRGAGLNPCTMDTDWDALTDSWEYDHAGTNALSGVTGRRFIDDGMDGTHGPANETAYSIGDAYTAYDMYVTGSGAVNRNMDYDRDGLENYQEYWVQAVRHFRYDYTADFAAMDGSDGPSVFFTPITNPWDLAVYSYWWLPFAVTQEMLLPVGAGYFVSTDPREPDTDFDGMDDYYEMFHGLNPILGDTTHAYGDRVARAYLNTIDYGSDDPGNDWGTGLPMDFQQYPWLAGMDEADPDADGLRNLEEQIQPDTAAASCSNTDPTPMWMTDLSSTNSLTARFYGWGGEFFWPGALTLDEDYKMYSFEMNEGYDTDNDGVSDKAEKVQAATALSDPQDQDDPLRRQAMWFDGVQSAAQTLTGYSYNEWAFRSFTVELWVRPEDVSRDQVLIERPIVYGASDLSTTSDVVRVNFRLGIAADGRVYGLFQNAGGQDAQTGVVEAYGRKLSAGVWWHIAAKMDGSAGLFKLFVNGNTELSVPTTQIPANGVLNILSDPDSAQYPTPYRITLNPGLVVLGASNLNPFPSEPASWGNYTNFYAGYIDEVRVWDGARTDNEILEGYTKRFTRDDVDLNREEIQAALAEGGSRVAGSAVSLPAELIYHYTFDNLYSSDVTNTVTRVPRGFNYWTAATNRPSGYLVGWWSELATHSQVYSDYGYVPWIENSVEHLPMTNGVVRNSVYWSNVLAGEIPTDPSAHGLTQYSFPNTGNPYGLRYNTSLQGFSTESVGEKIGSDLLPLGNAWAKQISEMWDDGTPSGVWAETGTDEDADGLADWWENLHGLDPASSAGANGWYGDADGDGIINGEEYLRDIANGWRDGDTIVSGPTGLVQTADVDNDGLPDWWENIFNLKTNDGGGDNGALGDPDLDGLSNFAEYLLAEELAFNPALRPNQFRSSAEQKVSDYFLKEGKLYYGQMMADHDFMEDDWEGTFAQKYVSRFVYDPHLDNDDDGWSNWSECRYSKSAVNVLADSVMTTEALGNMKYEFPIPLIETTLRYGGVQSDGNIILNAYSSAEMDGLPDAVFKMPFGKNTTASAKTLALGYWENRLATGVMSPGSIQPGTISFKFTDMWTGISSGTGFDFDGILYGGSVTGNMRKVGTVNYLTGEFTFDMREYEGTIILLSDEIESREDYIDCEISYIEMSYSVKLVDGWPKKLYLSRADTGAIREGLNYLFAFVDLDNNGIWNAGEPCGVSDGNGVDIGYDRVELDLELTDYTSGYLRMSLSSGRRSEDVYFGYGQAGGGLSGGLANRVRVQRKSVDGKAAKKVVFDKVIDSDRTYVHEGDLFDQGLLALDWGMSDVSTSWDRTTVVYEVFTGDRAEAALTNNAVALFTNTFDVAQAKAVATAPINGAYVYSARPTFKWTAPDGYPAFAIEIKKNSSTGLTVYQSGALQVPPRNNLGEYVWEAPIYAGSRLPYGTNNVFEVNKVYAWRVIALNAKFASTAGTWSDWRLFRLDVNTPMASSGYGAVRARVKYFGPAADLSNKIRVQAYRNAAFAGEPEAEVSLTDVNSLTSAVTPVVNAQLKGLAASDTAGSYYVRAYIDHNQNSKRDVWESWGYACYYGVAGDAYVPRPVQVAYATDIPVVDIVIEDADSDQDWFPDAWEYEQNSSFPDFLSRTGPATGTSGMAEVNPTLSAVGLSMTTLFTTLASGTTDKDGDGLGDLAELLLGTDAASSSTAKDGYADGDKVALGLSPEDTLRLNVTGLNLGADLVPVVEWTVEVQKADGTDSNTLGLLSSTAPGSTVSYQVLYTPSLENPNWQPVQSGTVSLSGVQSLQDKITAVTQIDPSLGFFRVKLLK